MHKKSALSMLFSAVVLAAVIFCIVWKNSGRPVQFNTRTWVVMGTIAGYSSRSSEAETDKEARIVSSAFAEIERDFSVRSPSSLLNAVSATAGGGTGAVVRLRHGLPAESNMLHVISFARRIAQETGGAFDPTVNPLMRVWGFRKPGRESPPSGDEIRSALELCGWEKIEIMPSGDSSEVRLASGEGAGIDLGGIAKGFAVDMAYERLVSSGATNFCINLGGNIRVCGTPSVERDSWTVGIRDPQAGDGKNTPLMKQSGRTLELHSGEAVATSGSYERFVEIDGVRLSHIIDPRSGYPVPAAGSVSVVAPSAMEADALSTAVFVMGEEEGTAFIKARRGCRAEFVR